MCKLRQFRIVHGYVEHGFGLAKEITITVLRRRKKRSVGRFGIGNREAKPVAVENVIRIVEHIVYGCILVVNHFGRPIVVHRPGFVVVGLIGNARALPVRQILRAPRLNAVAADVVARSVGVEIALILSLGYKDDRRVGNREIQRINVE